MTAWLRKLWCCWIWRFHDWTCAAAEGIAPTVTQITGGVDGFFDYARMYCRRCGKVYDPKGNRDG